MGNSYQSIRIRTTILNKIITNKQKTMILKTVYAPIIYVDEQTGRIINREELKNLSYKSRLEQHGEK